MRWTEAQRKTIETRGKNILVSAAAGSGKTTVLIERIKQLVLRDRVDIDRFLITTFTNAAAAEMKEKMERAIHEELERQGSAREEAFLQRQLDLLPQASISTFHTFCIGIMRDFFYLTDLQPGFIIGDETRLSIMRDESVSELFERRFAEDSDAFKAFLRKYSEDRSDRKLKQQLLDIYLQLRSIPRYMDWAEARTRLLEDEDPLGMLGIDRFILEETKDALTEAIHWYEAAAELLDTEATASLCLKARQDAEKLAELRGMTEETCDLDVISEILEGFKPNQMRAAKDEKDAFEAIRDDVSWLRKQGKNALDTLRKNYYARPLRQDRETLRESAGDTMYFAGLLRELEEIYREKKRAENMVDFDDCMHYVIGILEDEGAAAEVRDRYEYIFIDEYQDSNLLQEEIVGQIARSNNLFMVGDVKQSIYKFRLAEPEIFRGRYERYRSGSDADSLRIDLNSNFRSRKRIRDAVNRIFDRIMEGYDEDARLNGPEDEEFPGYPVTLHILDKSAAAERESNREQTAEETDSSGDTDLTEEVTEFEIIAGIIRECLGQTVVERDGTVRPVEYGDIAVLSRGGSMISRIERYLNNEGIPAFGETAGGYYETVEIQVFLNLLKVISNLNQDIPLISAMSSVVFDFTPRQLALIRIAYPEGSFYSAVRQYEQDGEDPLIRGKVSEMLGQISLWKEISRTLPLDELMRTLLFDTGYYDYCSGLPAGQQRTSNLRLLLNRAAAYEETSYLGLYGFLSYVEAMRRTNQKVSEASLVGEGMGVVHVMTVHKSKGLEFPVVILSGAGRKITGPAEGRAPVTHKDFAIGLPEVDREHHWERKTILQKAIAGKKKREGLEEEIRILYVALTRPMLRLDIVGSVKEAGKLQRFAGKGTFLDMIYGTFCDMAEKDPEAARIRMYPAEDMDEEGHAVPPAEAAENAAEAAAGSSEPIEDAEEPAPEAREEGISVREGGEKASARTLDPQLIDFRLSWEYPYTEQRKVKTKYSVTELAREAEREEESAAGSGKGIPQLRMPEAIETAEGTGRRLAAAQIGTAMHTVMERVDFHAALEQGMPYIRSMIDQMHGSGFLTDEEYRAVKPEHIHRFFETELGARAARAGSVAREKEFLLRKEIDGVPTVVQGVIDCYFEDSDGLVLIDYKNSWIDASEEEAQEIMTRRYGGQIELYREALQKALDRPVDEAWLYLFRTGTFIPIP